MEVRQFSPNLGQDEIDSVLETFDANWLTEGPKTAALEKQLAEYTGSKHVLMVPNGTLALFVALKVLGIGPGDEVLVPDLTFFGSASAVVLTGAKPVFVDVRPDDFNIDVESAKQSLSPNTTAVMPVHIYGQPCDMKQVMAFAGENNLRVVEDAAQGVGVRFRDQHVGTFGDIGCMSFFADKTITTGEGGALFVNDDALADQCMYFKNQGRLQRGSFVHPYLGYNFRITDLQAAVGVVQMKRLPDLIEGKRRVLAHYQAGLADCPRATIPAANGLGQSVPFRICVLVDDPEGLGAHLQERGVQTRRFFYPLHLQPALTPENSVIRVTPVNSVRSFERGLSLPSSVDLSAEQISYVCECIQEFCLCKAG